MKRSAQSAGLVLAAVFVSGVVLIAELPAESVNARRERIRRLEAESSALLNASRIAEAIPILEKLAELQPYNEPALYRLALALLYQQQIGEERDYQRDLLRARNLLAESVQRLERIQTRGSDLSMRHFHLGMAQWMLGERDAALASFERSYRADFLRVDALYNQYALLQELGQNSAAEAMRLRYVRLVSRGDLDD